jgi:hypothetical protein
MRGLGRYPASRTPTAIRDLGRPKAPDQLNFCSINGRRDVRPVGGALPLPPFRPPAVRTEADGPSWSQSRSELRAERLVVLKHRLGAGPLVPNHALNPAPSIHEDRRLAPGTRMDRRVAWRLRAIRTAPVHRVSREQGISDGRQRSPPRGLFVAGGRGNRQSTESNEGK